MQYSSDEISVEEDVIPPMDDSTKNNSLKYLPRWPPVNIEFQDLSYNVPDLSGMYHIIYIRRILKIPRTFQFSIY